MHMNFVERFASSERQSDWERSPRTPATRIGILRSIVTCWEAKFNDEMIDVGLDMTKIDVRSDNETEWESERISSVSCATTYWNLTLEGTSKMSLHYQSTVACLAVHLFIRVQPKRNTLGEILWRISSSHWNWLIQVTIDLSLVRDTCKDERQTSWFMKEVSVLRSLLADNITTGGCFERY